MQNIYGQDDNEFPTPYVNHQLKRWSIRQIFYLLILQYVLIDTEAASRSPFFRQTKSLSKCVKMYTDHLITYERLALTCFFCIILAMQTVITPRFGPTSAENFSDEVGGMGCWNWILSITNQVARKYKKRWGTKPCHLVYKYNPYNLWRRHYNPALLRIRTSIYDFINMLLFSASMPPPLNAVWHQICLLVHQQLRRCSRKN